MKPINKWICNDNIFLNTFLVTKSLDTNNRITLTHSVSSSRGTKIFDSTILVSNKRTRGNDINIKASRKWRFSLALQSLKNLENNWDGNGSKAPMPETISIAHDVANHLIDQGYNITFCYPLPDGGIQLEGPDPTIEFEVNTDMIVKLVFNNEGDLLEEEQINVEDLIIPMLV